MTALRSGIDTSTADPTVRIQDDLFGHVHGRWLATHEIPADRALDGTFFALRDKAEDDVRALLHEASAVGDAATPPQRQVGDLFAAFCDEEQAERLGRTPLADDLAAVTDVTDLGGLAQLVGRFQREGLSGFLETYVTADPGDPGTEIIHLGQAGLGLPDESYYREQQFAAIREAYVPHVARMLALAEYAAEGEDADAAAQRVMALETRLAGAHWDRVRSRDAIATFNPHDATGLASLVPALDLPAWWVGLGAGPEAFQRVVVHQPSFLQGLSAALAETDLQAWRDWAAWDLVRDSAAYLDAEVVQTAFDFYGTTLTGAPQLRERWRRGIGVVEACLGEAVGQLYVERHFPEVARTRMAELVANLVEAYRRRIEVLDWMSPTTRARALDKLTAFRSKVGHPATFRDYAAVRVERTDLLGSVRRAAVVESDRQLAKVGKPVDLDEWLMTPQTINAYYHPLLNEIVFPAAILQPPFFDAEADDAVNYGAIGAVIGHEIGHGFDDQGSRYDGTGALVDWWTEEDRARFDERAQALIAQYDALPSREVVGERVNGALTVGENIGDLGGVTVALEAYRLSLDGDEAPVLDGFTGEQRFFWGWAQAWRGKSREAEARRRLTIDPHAPVDHRCNVVRNLADFHAAFGVTPDDGLWLEPQARVRIW